MRLVCGTESGYACAYAETVGGAPYIGRRSAATRGEALMKLRGSTDFSFKSRLSIDQLAAEINTVVQQFVHDNEHVHRGTVTNEDDEFTVELVIDTTLFGFADDMMLALGRALRSRLTSMGAEVEEHATELVPA